MVIRSWLKSLSIPFEFNRRRNMPRIRRTQMARAAVVEMLESRQLLAAAPVLSAIETTPLSYTEGPKVPVTSSIAVTDAGATMLVSATVAISNNYNKGEDLLSFVDTAQITGAFNSTTGVLTLTGVDTLANYQAALRAVMYQTNDNPGSSPRTISFTANNGQSTGNLSNVATRVVDVTPVNDPPVLSSIETTPLQFGSGQSATPITSTLQVTDPDNVNLTGATVTITGNYQNGEDILAFINSSTITGTFSAATGTLTLSGTDTVASYQALLRTVTYKDTSATPNTSTRTISFQTTDGASSTFDSNVVTRSVAIKPVLSGIETTTLTYSVNDGATNTPAKAITASIVVSAATGEMITGATVQITSGYQSGQDKLAFTNTPSITGTFNSTTGILTLTGTATAAEYQAALRAVTYQNTSASATGQTRTALFTVTGTNSDVSNSQSRSINVQSSVVVSGIETTPVSYTEGQAPVHVTSTLTVTDSTSTNISGAVVKITNPQTGDVLAFANTAKITGTYDATTGTLTLSGTDTVANYQATLRAVTYQNTTNNPGSVTRTVSFQVGTTLLTTAVTRAIDVTPINSVPVISNIETRRLRHRHHRGPSQVSSTLTISVEDSPTLTGASVQIGNFHSGGDVLAFTKIGNITGTFDTSTGILTLTGTDSVANYQAVLRSVTFDDSGSRPRGTREIRFSVSNGTTQSAAVERTVRVRR